MSDIVKCDNSKCPMKDRCHRWLAPDKDNQKYAHWGINKFGRCFGFWKIKGLIINNTNDVVKLTDDE